MASSKYTFGSNTFAANMFASGVWRGTGPVPAYLNTTGVFTVTNITETRSIDVATASLNNAINLIGTAIYDIQEGLWNPASYTIVNSSEVTTIDCASTSLDEILDFMATMVIDGLFDAEDYTVSNNTPTYVMDCLSTDFNELVNVLTSLLLVEINDVIYRWDTLDISESGLQNIVEVLEINVGFSSISGRNMVVQRDRAAVSLEPVVAPYTGHYVDEVTINVS